jgi:hypothetical protein
MKNPMKFQQRDPGSAIRRDTMIGTAVMLLVETALIGTAAAMDGIRADAAEQEQHTGAEAARKGARPFSSSKPLPDTHIGSGNHPHGVPSEPPDDGGDLSPVDFSRIGVDGLHHPRELGDAPFMHGIGHARFDDGAGQGNFGTGRSFGHQGHGATGADLSEAGEDPASTPEDPDTEPQEANVRLGTDGKDTIEGGEDSDYIFGRDGDDLLFGRGGNDRLLGGRGDDILSGGNGNDFIVGDKGNDEMTGGAGADTFLFRAGYGHDTVMDFKAGGDLDVIEVAKSEFADFAALSHSLTASDLGAVLTLHDGSTLTLSHVPLSSLSASDFRFEV